MAAGTDAIILAALLDHLASLTFTPALPIAYPGVDFPAAGQTKPKDYLAAFFLPNQTVSYPVGDGAYMHRGFLQVSVFCQPGSGLIKPLDIAGKVIGHFPKNTVLFSGAVKVKIPREPWASIPIQEDDRVHIPVSIPYESLN